MHHGGADHLHEDDQQNGEQTLIKRPVPRSQFSKALGKKRNYKPLCYDKARQKVSRSAGTVSGFVAKLR